MCCSVSESSMSNTLIYVGEGQRDNKLVHVIAYQNKAENLSNGPNAMVIPFPAGVPMNEQNVIDTSNFKSFLSDITEATRRSRRRSASFSKSMMLGNSCDEALVFDVGSYTVVLADSVEKVSAAMNRVTEKKRPIISEEFLIGYGKLYPDQPIAVCCWNGSIEAEPLLWWYEPKNSEVLFVPTMDAHDGKSPNVEMNVYTDHNISAGSSVYSSSADQVNYSEELPAHVVGLLPSHVHGTKIQRSMKNGDMFIKTSQLITDNVIASRGVNFETSKSEVRLDGWS